MRKSEKHLPCEQPQGFVQLASGNGFDGMTQIHSAKHPHRIDTTDTWTTRASRGCRTGGSYLCLCRKNIRLVTNLMHRYR